MDIIHQYREYTGEVYSKYFIKLEQRTYTEETVYLMSEQVSDPHDWNEESF